MKSVRRLKPAPLLKVAVIFVLHDYVPEIAFRKASEDFGGDGEQMRGVSDAWWFPSNLPAGRCAAGISIGCLGRVWSRLHTRVDRANDLAARIGDGVVPVVRARAADADARAKRQDRRVCRHDPGTGDGAGRALGRVVAGPPGAGRAAPAAAARSAPRAGSGTSGAGGG